MFFRCFFVCKSMVFISILKTICSCCGEGPPCGATVYRVLVERKNCDPFHYPFNLLVRIHICKKTVTEKRVFHE